MTDRSTVRYLLDTNICIYIAKGQPLAVRARFEQHALHDVAMSTITLGELRFGAEKSQARERALNTIEQLMQVIPACALPLGNRHTQPGIQFRPLRFRGVKL